MSKPALLADELSEMRCTDAEIDRSFRLTHGEIREATERDKEAASRPVSPERAYNRAQCKKYQATHKDEIAEKHRAYYVAHREERIAYQAEYDRTHREELRAYYRARYQKKKAAPSADTLTTAKEILTSIF